MRTTSFVVFALTARLAVAATVGVEAEDFQFPGDWRSEAAHVPQTSGRGLLIVPAGGARLPALTAVRLPAAGRYRLWVRSLDFPHDRPGIRTFTAAVGGHRGTGKFGASGREGWAWEPGGDYDLPGGETLLALYDVAGGYGRCDAVLLTTDATFQPTGPLGQPNHPRTAPVPLPSPPGADPLAAPAVTVTSAAPVATLANEHLRLTWWPARRGDLATVAPRVEVRTGDTWRAVDADAGAEAYLVVGGPAAALRRSGFHATWTGAPAQPFDVAVGGVTERTALTWPEAVWNAGVTTRFVPRAVQAADGLVHLTFHPTPAGELTAEWALRPGEHAARVALRFTAKAAGSYGVGYHSVFRRPLAAVRELLLPMMWQRRRLPAKPMTLLQPYCPTPVALAQGDEATCGVVAEPADLPFAWPDPADPHFGLMIRDFAGAVQPAIYAPVPGTPAAQVKAGGAAICRLRALAVPGDWYAGFRVAADEVCGLRDYRTNVGTSLTDAALNMIDLVLDDDHGGWWPEAKGPYQIETLNGATQASPLTPLSLYRLTGDPALLARRAIPSLEFVLSRNGAHFSPTPQNTGSYPAGAMTGPVRLYGTTTYGGLWQATHQRTPAFRSIALPGDGVATGAGYSHNQEFEEWLARYELTGEAAALAKARGLADVYLAKQVTTPPTAEISPEPFFNLTFVPDWEGLLRLYEATHEQRYLDGAVLGARQLMTGIWSQPVVPAGDVTVHPGGAYPGCVPAHQWWKGPVKYRLGWPRRPGDTPEHRAPAWTVSNVGLGFEQPITFAAGDSAGRLIYQSAFAPHFLRLAAYTGDSTFETYARNGVLGRFANYPGYYVVGQTDAPLDPRYPLRGPDVSCIYYHHILPHLAWTIDYLVTEATTRSGGRIRFPAVRQHGYAWFDSRLYGHAPGTVYGHDGAWLWLRRGVVDLDNPAVNWLTAHTERQLLVVLLNENRTPEAVTVRLHPAALGGPLPATATLLGAAGGPVALTGGAARVTVPGRGLVVLVVDGVHVSVPGHQAAAAPQPGPAPASVTLPAGQVEVRAAAIQIDPGPWEAYVWCTGSPTQLRRVKLEYSLGGAWQTIEDATYPFEFSIPVAEPQAVVRFRVAGEPVTGPAWQTAEATLSALR